MKKTKRILVRAENPSGACGYVGHLTADELKTRAVGDHVDGTCPICGMVHLCRREIEELERSRTIDSTRYRRLRNMAEVRTSSPNPAPRTHRR